MNAEKDLALFKFDDSRTAGLWRPINDVVMGRSSDGQLLRPEPGRLYFPVEYRWQTTAGLHR